jgi:hypothetical protein
MHFKHSVIIYKQDRQCTCNVTLWRVRVMFIPPRLFLHPYTTVLEKAFVVKLCRWQQLHVFRLRKVPDIFFPVLNKSGISVQIFG